MLFQTVGAKTAPKPEPSPEKDNSDSSEKQEEATNAPVFDELGGNTSELFILTSSLKLLGTHQF